MKLLVTTAIEETWGTHQDIIFLGEWCKLYGRKEKWQARKHETKTYNWDNREKMYSDALYLDKLYERILVDLAVEMNRIHSVNYSLSYWRVLVGIWLGYFIQILFQRWDSITNATFDESGIQTIIIDQHKENLVPQEMLNFVNLFCSDIWNHYLFGEIIRFQKKINFKVIESNGLKAENSYENKISLKGKIKAKILSIAWKIEHLFNSIFAKEKEVFFITTYLSLINQIKLNLRFNQVPKFFRSRAVQFSKIDINKRDWNWSTNDLPDFERFLKKMIPLQIPLVYLEGYLTQNAQIEVLSWPKWPRIIFTANSHIYDDFAKFWIANKIENGTPLVIGQHGGGPLHKLNFQTDHELAICQKYLFPGNGDTNWHNKVIGVGQFFRRKWNYNRKGGGLLIELIVPRYSYAISSTVQSDDFVHYLSDQRKFAEALPLPIREQFIVRLSPSDHSWEMKSRWQDSFPEFAIDYGKKSIYKLFKQSKIIVCTYAATTYNQTLAANAPTIIFWDENYNQMHDLAIPYFDALKKVGIFHATPESAANQIAIIWDDVEIWWNSKEVQEARILFCEKYAYNAHDLLDNIEDSIIKIIKK